MRYEHAEGQVRIEADHLLALYSTTSALAALPDDERAELFAEVRRHLVGPYSLPIKHELAWTLLA